MRTTELAVVGLVCAGSACAVGACGGDDTQEDPTTASSSTVSAGGATSSSSKASSSTATSGNGGDGGGGAGQGGQGGGASGDWSCLGNVMWPAPVKPTISLDLTFVKFMSTTGIPNLTVKACALADTACATPIDTKTSDAAGKVTLTVPTGTAGFDGFAEITGSEIPNSLAFVFPYVGDDKTATLQLIDTSSLNTFAALLQINLDATRGHVAADVLDCSFDTGAPGVSVSADTADATTVQIYVNGSLPSKTQTETDASGITGLFNIPAGSVTLTGKVAASSQTMGSASVLVRPQTITYTTLPPSP